MPTLSKAQLIETQSPWGAAFDRMYLELCRDRVRILSALGFFAERNLPTPEENSDAIPTPDEEAELRQIASALTVAAAASEVMSTSVLVATLLRVSKEPRLFVPRELPQPVEWAIANDYQRGDEPPGTHWRDVWGRPVATFPGRGRTTDRPEYCEGGRRRNRPYSGDPEGWPPLQSGRSISCSSIGRYFSTERAADTSGPRASHAPRPRCLRRRRSLL
jgi:hypothetical protein